MVAVIRIGVFVNRELLFMDLMDITITSKIKWRFESNFSKNDDSSICWEWEGEIYKNTKAPRFAIKYKYYSSNRVSYYIYKESFDDNLYVLHTCDFKLCVNPNHLYLGTQQDNMNDRTIRNRGFIPQGELHGRSQLIEEDIGEIFNLYNNHKYTHQEIANLYEVCPATISNILNHKTWKQLTKEYK